MEAMVLDREEAEMVEWDDGRLDERFRAIDQRFDGVDRRMDEGFTRTDEGFARMDAAFRELNGRFDSLQRTLIQIGFGFGAALIALIAALIGTIATQL